jgi:hypothetical protein
MESFKIHRLEFILRQTEFIPLSRLAIDLKVTERQIERYIAELKIKNVDIEVLRKSKFKNINEPHYRINTSEIIDDPGLNSVQFNQLMDMMDNYQDIDKHLRGKLLYILSKDRYAAHFTSENEKKVRNCMKKPNKLIVKTYHHRDGDITPLVLVPIRLDSYNGRLYAFRENENFNEINKYNLELMELDDSNYIGDEFDVKKTAGDLPFDPFKKQQDSFGFYNKGEEFDVSILLKPFAYSQLFRQFPHLLAFVTKMDVNEGEYMYFLNIKVYDIQPIARFVTGLFDEIKIKGNELVKKEIRAYIEKRVFGGLKINY